MYVYIYVCMIADEYIYIYIYIYMYTCKYLGRDTHMHMICETSCVMNSTLRVDSTTKEPLL